MPWRRAVADACRGARKAFLHDPTLLLVPPAAPAARVNDLEPPDVTIVSKDIHTDNQQRAAEARKAIHAVCLRFSLKLRLRCARLWPAAVARPFFQGRSDSRQSRAHSSRTVPENRFFSVPIQGEVISRALRTKQSSNRWNFRRRVRVKVNNSSSIRDRVRSLRRRLPSRTLRHQEAQQACTASGIHIRSTGSIAVQRYAKERHISRASARTALVPPSKCPRTQRRIQILRGPRWMHRRAPQSSTVKA